MFEAYDSYDQFLPLIYGQYSGGTEEVFSSLCYQQIDQSFTNYEVRNTICQKLGFSTGMYFEEGMGSDYNLGGDVGSVDLTSFDMTIPWWDFGPTMNGDCTNHLSDVVVECESYDSYCLNHNDECATDLDCCDKMFCSQVSGTCVNIVE